MTRDAERASVAQEARTWIGTPFHSGAAIKGAGVDCARLLAASFALIVDVPIPNYPPDWFLHTDEEKLLNVIRTVCVPVDAADVGDIAVFRFGRAVSHGGIIVDRDPLLMVHAYRPSKGVQLDSLDTGSGLMTRFAGFWRLARWAE